MMSFHSERHPHKRVSVRLAAVGGERVKAELAALGKQGRQALESIAGATAPANAGLTGLGATAGQALGQLEALGARALQAAGALRAAGASTGTLVERIDRVTGVAAVMRRSAEDIATYGAALDDLRARHNPLFAVIRDYKGTLAEIRHAHRVGAISAEEMTAAISRERQTALASIAALKGRAGALEHMGAASRMAAFQSRLLLFQLNDVFVWIASGMNPLMVFIQQGSQIAQIYGPGEGGVGRALKETGRMVARVVTRLPLLTAAVAAGGAAVAVRHLKESGAERERQREVVAKVRVRLDAIGIPHLDNPSHIIPVMVGDPVKCKMLSDILLDAYGIYVQPINYPTVEKGTERLRITPSPVHTDAAIERLVAALGELGSQCALSRAVA